MPVHEANERWINLVDEAPDPIHPERSEAFNRRSTNVGAPSLQVRPQPSHNLLGDRFVDPPILVECQSPADPRTVRLVPHAPIPIANSFGAPAFHSAPDHIAALVRT